MRSHGRDGYRGQTPTVPTTVSSGGRTNDTSRDVARLWCGLGLGGIEGRCLIDAEPARALPGEHAGGVELVEKSVATEGTTCVCEWSRRTRRWRTDSTWRMCSVVSSYGGELLRPSASDRASRVGLASGRPRRGRPRCREVSSRTVHVGSGPRRWRKGLDVPRPRLGRPARSPESRREWSRRSGRRGRPSEYRPQGGRRSRERTHGSPGPSIMTAVVARRNTALAAGE
jgi:hypothetical protein